MFSSKKRQHDLFEQRASWDMQKDRILFFFELGFVSALFIFTVYILHGSFSGPVQVSAIGALVYIGRAVIAHLTSSI